MAVVEWFTLLVGVLFTVVAIIYLLFMPKDDGRFSFFMILEMVFSLTATIVALQAIRT